MVVMSAPPWVGIVVYLLLGTWLGAMEPALAGEEFIVTGNEWIASDDDSKNAFLVGVATVIDAEQEYQGRNPPANSSIPVLAQGLGKLTLVEIKQTLDDYYSRNPKQLDRPIMHVLWDLAVRYRPVHP
jgi:hypothetical protein